jgi:hypothetical protein
MGPFSSKDDGRIVGGDLRWPCTVLTERGIFFCILPSEHAWLDRAGNEQRIPRRDAGA